MHCVYSTRKLQYWSSKDNKILPELVWYWDCLQVQVLWCRRFAILGCWRLKWGIIRRELREMAVQWLWCLWWMWGGGKCGSNDKQHGFFTMSALMLKHCSFPKRFCFILYNTALGDLSNVECYWSVSQDVIILLEVLSVCEH